MEPGGAERFRFGTRDALFGLVSGQAVVISDDVIFTALFHAGIPSDDYAYGGRYWGKQFLLAENGTLTEYVEDVPSLGGSS